MVMQQVFFFFFFYEIYRSEFIEPCIPPKIFADFKKNIDAVSNIYNTQIKKYSDKINLKLNDEHISLLEDIFSNENFGKKTEDCKQIEKKFLNILNTLFDAKETEPSKAYTTLNNYFRKYILSLESLINGISVREKLKKNLIHLFIFLLIFGLCFYLVYFIVVKKLFEFALR